jgi:hypothetical protein
LSLVGCPTAGQILSWGIRGFGFFVALDRDDELGKLELNVSPIGANVEEKTWRFRRIGSIWNSGWSTWDYTVRYRITRY